MKSNKSLKQRASEMVKAAEMPRDVVMGIPVLSIVGNKEICIENYGGIIEYTDEIVRIRTKKGQIIICGKQLYVEYYTNDEMKISGNFSSVEFKY